MGDYSRCEAAPVRGQARGTDYHLGEVLDDKRHAVTHKTPLLHWWLIRVVCWRRLVEMAQDSNTQQALLDDGVQQIRTALSARGFEYSAGDQGVSSGGRFAVASFRRADLILGLIVRHGTGLGAPNYSMGHGYAGHDRLVVALGRSGEERLVETRRFSWGARDGGDPFDALLHDLEHIVLPALDKSESEFRVSLARAVRDFREQLGLENL
jgi:hypothetical protein